MSEAVLAQNGYFTTLHKLTFNIILSQPKIFQFEDKGSACLRLQLLLVAIEVCGKTVQLCLVQHTEMFLQRSICIENGAYQKVGTDSILRIPTFGLESITNGQVTHQFEVVQGIAIE